MKTPNFYLKFAFKSQIIGSVLLFFKIPTPPFTLVQLDRDKKTLTSKSSRFICSIDLRHPEKILEKVAQLHDDRNQEGDKKKNAT